MLPLQAIKKMWPKKKRRREMRSKIMSTHAYKPKCMLYIASTCKMLKINWPHTLK